MTPATDFALAVVLEIAFLACPIACESSVSDRLTCSTLDADLVGLYVRAKPTPWSFAKRLTFES